jgi:hypothetical protein
MTWLAGGARNIWLRLAHSRFTPNCELTKRDTGTSLPCQPEVAAPQQQWPVYLDQRTSGEMHVHAQDWGMPSHPTPLVAWASEAVSSQLI